MSNSEEEVNPYELLGLNTESTENEIKTAYRKLSLKVHPDRVSSSCPVIIYNVQILTTLKNRGNPDAGGIPVRPFDPNADTISLQLASFTN